jgi:hypothetical protein
MNKKMRFTSYAVILYQSSVFLIILVFFRNFGESSEQNWCHWEFFLKRKTAKAHSKGYEALELLYLFDFADW